MQRLIVYNIEYCEGMLGKNLEYLELWKVFMPPKNLDKQIVDELHKYDPDILALVEVDTGSIRARKDEVKFFSKEMHMNNYVEKVKYPNNGISAIMNHVPILRKQGNAIVTKDKINHIRFHELKEGTKRVVIEVSVNADKNVTLLLAHLALGKKARQSNFEDLIKIVQAIEGPVILMGDFNTFNGLVEIERLLGETHLENHYKVSHQKNVFTQPTYNPKRKLDYVLTSKEIKVKDYKILDFHFSDHLPIMVDFKVD